MMCTSRTRLRSISLCAHSTCNLLLSGLLLGQKELNHRNSLKFLLVQFCCCNTICFSSLCSCIAFHIVLFYFWCWVDRKRFPYTFLLVQICSGLWTFTAFTIFSFFSFAMLFVHHYWHSDRMTVHICYLTSR